MKSEKEELLHDANRIAWALMGMSESRQRSNDADWDRRADELESNLRKLIAELREKARANEGQ